MTQLLVVLLAISLVLALGTLFLLILSNFADDRRDVADVKRLRDAQYRIQQFQDVSKE